MTDDMLRALSKKGGVVHINYFEGFLEPGFVDRYNALKAEQTQEEEIEPDAEIRRPQPRRSRGAQDRRSAHSQAGTRPAHSPARQISSTPRT